MTFHDRGTSWFLAQLKPNCANIADKNLKRQGFQTFLPMEEETRQREGQVRHRHAADVSGLHLRGLRCARGLWRTVNSTYGITRLVSFRQGADGMCRWTGLAADAALRYRRKTFAAKAFEAR